MMANLPLECLGYRQPPFANCGVDNFDPFDLKFRRNSEKLWGLIFTCMTTRAIHLEVASSEGTHSCVMGIERFIARRGPPYVIRSDYGRNFVSSAKDLISCIANWNRHSHVQLAHEGLIWKLIHPVRLTMEVCEKKECSMRFSEQENLAEEVVVTTLCIDEHSLNNRPSNFEALKPNQFLFELRGSSFQPLGIEHSFNHRKCYA